MSYLCNILVQHLCLEPSRATPCGLSSTVPETSSRLSPSFTKKATSTQTSNHATSSGALMTSPSSSLTLASASNRETRWVFVIILNILTSTIYSLTLEKHDAMTEVKDVSFYRRFSLTLNIVQQILKKSRKRWMWWEIQVHSIVNLALIRWVLTSLWWPLVCGFLPLLQDVCRCRWD